MPVIITDMDMPKNCAECPIFYDFMECSITTTHADFEQMNSKRLSDCPLKSANEMIKEIKIKM